MKLHSTLSNIHLYRLPENRGLQWDEVGNWSSASGVLLLFATFPVKSMSALTITLPTSPGHSLLRFYDGFGVLCKDTTTTKLVPDDFVYFLAVKVFILKGVMSTQENVGRLTRSKSPKANDSDVLDFIFSPPINRCRNRRFYHSGALHQSILFPLQYIFTS